MSSYYELLRHPDWQRKRLEILKAADFTCTVCGSKEKTLSIHHSYYEKGLKPWEYPAESLHCLCDDCHKDAQDVMKQLHRQIGKIGLEGAQRLYGYAMAIESGDVPFVPLDVFSLEIADGLADFWRVSPRDVIDMSIEGSIDGYRLQELSNRTKG